MCVMFRVGVGVPGPRLPAALPRCVQCHRQRRRRLVRTDILQPESNSLHFRHHCQHRQDQLRLYHDRGTYKTSQDSICSWEMMKKEAGTNICFKYNERRLIRKTLLTLYYFAIP